MTKQISYCILLAVVFLTSYLGYRASFLQFDYNLNNFFPVKDTESVFFKEFKSNFENDDDFLLLGIESKTSIFDYSFLSDVAVLTKELEQYNLVSTVVSPTNCTNLIFSPSGLIKQPYIHLDDISQLKNDSIRIYKTSFLVNNLFSNDGKSIGIYIKTKPNIFKPKSDSLLNFLNSVLIKKSFSTTHLAGKVYAQKTYIEKMQTEMVVFTSISVLILVVLLYFAFKTWWGIVIPFVVILFSIICTLGFYQIMGQHIDIMTVILPTILFVVGLSDVVHFVTKYLEELREGKSTSEAINITLKEVGFATFLTAFTTALGFATLALANVVPIQNFGIYTALGVLMAYVLSFSLLPAILFHLKKPKITEVKQIFWDIKLHQLFRWVLKKKFYILGVFSVLLIVSFGLLFKIETNSKILEDISDKDPLMKDFKFFEQKFGGVRSFEMEVSLKDSTDDFLRIENLKALEKTETYLSTIYKVNNIISLVSIVKMLNMSLNGGLQEFYKLPDNEDDLKSIKKIIRKYQKIDFIKKYVNSKKNKLRFSGKTIDEGSYVMKNKNILFYEKMNAHSSFDYHITGTAHLINANNDYITKDMTEGLGLDLIVIGIIVAWMFRSLKMSFIALIPNFVPLLVVGAIMGLTGIELKLSTSIVFSIAFGIAVDDTIHFISKLKLELSKGKSLIYAVKRTYLSTGKAIIVTSLLLIGGFSTLLLSSFKGTFYLGLLVSLTLVIAVLADLFLLPVLVILFYKKRN